MATAFRLCPLTCMPTTRMSPAGMPCACTVTEPSRLTLSEVVKARYLELFQFIRKELHRADFYDAIAGGIVLTGGSSKVEGVIELAEEVFDLPVRLGLPQNVAGLTDVARSPIYSTAVGLLLYGRQQQGPAAPAPAGAGGGYWLQRLQTWFKGQF